MMPKQKMRDVSRFIFGGACEVEPDKQGRILLPANLRTYARIGETALIVGVGARRKSGMPSAMRITPKPWKAMWRN